MKITKSPYLRQRAVHSLLLSAIATGLYGAAINQAIAGDIYASYGGPASYVELYQDRCGNCHFAYPPSLLPQVSWQVTIAGLKNHFGKNVELQSNTEALIKGYLLANSMSYLKRFSHNGEGDIPLRITDLDEIQLQQSVLVHVY